MTSSSFLKLPVTLTGSSNPRLYPSIGIPAPTWRWDGLDLPAPGYGAVSSWSPPAGVALTIQSGTGPTVNATAGVNYLSWTATQGALGLTGMGNDAVQTLLMIVRMGTTPPAGGLFNGGAILLNANATSVTMIESGQTGTNPSVASVMSAWQVVVFTIPAGSPASGALLWVNGTQSTQTNNTTSASKVSQLLFGGGTTSMDVAGIAAWNSTVSPGLAAGAYSIIKSSYSGLGWS